MNVQVYCAMCGRSDIRNINLEGDAAEIVDRPLRDLVPAGWIVEINGSNVDIYCSQRCAA